MFQILYKSYLSSSALPGVKPFDGWPTSVLAYFISPQKYHGACLFYLKFNCFWGVLCFKLQQLVRVTMAASSSLLNQTELVNHSHRTAVGPDTTWETITLSVTPLIDGHMDQGFHAPWIITVQLHTLGALVIIIYVQGQVELSIFVNLANRDARFWVQSRAFSTTRLQRTWQFDDRMQTTTKYKLVQVVAQLVQHNLVNVIELQKDRFWSLDVLVFHS